MAAVRRLPLQGLRRARLPHPEAWLGARGVAALSAAAASGAGSADGTRDHARSPGATLLTVGHGTLEQEAFLDLLRGAGVEQVVDVRRFPGSRRHPHMARDLMADWLPDGGVGYRWEPRLGGRRSSEAGDTDAWWQVAAFRAYAAHARTAEFTAALDELLEGAAQERTVVMCSESVWWRCHRRIIADVATLSRGVVVQHLMPAGALREHVPAEGARVTPEGVVYDGPV